MPSVFPKYFNNTFFPRSHNLPEETSQDPFDEFLPVKALYDDDAAPLNPNDLSNEPPRQEEKKPQRTHMLIYSFNLALFFSLIIFSLSRP